MISPLPVWKDRESCCRRISSSVSLSLCCCSGTGIAHAPLRPWERDPMSISLVPSLLSRLTVLTAIFERPLCVA